MTIDSNSVNMNKSVTITMKLLQCLSETKVPMRLNDIASSIDFPQATVLRYLNSLMYEGYIFRDNNTGRYALTWKISGIGEQLKSNMSLRSISSDIIMELSSNLDFGIALVIEHNMECIYLDCIYESNDFDFTLMHIGKQAPMHTIGSGKLFLASLSEYDLNNYIEQKGLPKLTDQTITEKNQLIKELDKINKNGYAIDNEECEYGLKCVSVPIYGYMHKLVAAVSSFGAPEKLSEEIIQEKIIPLLKSAASEISYRLGFHEE